MKKFLICTSAIVLFTFVNYYFGLPPLNFSSPEFYSFILGIIVFSAIIINVVCFNFKNKVTILNNKIVFNSNDLSKKVKMFNVSVFILIVFTVVIIIAMNFCLSPIFNSKSYSNRIEINDKDFENDFSEVDFDKLPLLDKDSTSKLGDRTMGEMPEWVSQFTVSNLYTQINFKDDILRVTPLEYDGIIKYFTNKKDGVEGYITVDSVNGESNLVKIENGMKYLPSAYFNEDLRRKLTFTYPTKILGNEKFELDEDGNPYWVVPTFKYSGVGLKKEVSGAVILDAVSGKSKFYKVKDIPSWVDQVYPSDLIIEQVDNWGTYVKGFINSIFGQKNVVNTTDGYNYLVIDNDVYLYTGITSVLADESNLGFILVNLRTKEASYFKMPGAEEYSAMKSAEGLVQEKDYAATFPLLINLEGNATYLLSLKDSAGLVKMYAFVDARNYQIVSTTESSKGIKKAAEEYLSKIDNKKVNDEIEKEIVVKEILNATIEGNTIYYIIDTDGNKYSAKINVAKNILPFIKENDEYNVTYNPGEVNNILTIK